MLSLFNKKTEESVAKLPHHVKIPLKTLYYAPISFDQFNKGIDNIHLDVHLSPHFVNLTLAVVQKLLQERLVKRRLTEKPSAELTSLLDNFGNSYGAILTATLHRTKEEKQVVVVQLFQLAVWKLVLTTVRSNADQLLYELRKATLREQDKSLELHERIKWFSRHHSHLVYQVNADLFAQLRWVESGAVKKLRESLLGVAWSIPEEMLFNPLLQSLHLHDPEVLMAHYVLLSEDPENEYGVDRLIVLLDHFWEKVASVCQLETVSSESFAEETAGLRLTGKDVPMNVEALLNVRQTLQELEETEGEDAELSARVECQRQALKLLENGLRQAQVLEKVVAAYETPRLYEHYGRLLKPLLLHQALCGEIDVEEVEEKLEAASRGRRGGENPWSIGELVKTKKQVQRLAQRPDSEMLVRLVKDVVTYRRDVKLFQSLSETLEDIHLLTKEADVQLSRSNGLLNEFLEQEESAKSLESIRGHVILKADIRGSTTVTSELCRQGLNPATHFSRNFFDPIRKLHEIFGAEKVFIEGDAIILSIFEYQNAPEHWLATARACGLAKSMLEVVYAQNQVSRSYQLPELELGIGICYYSEAPKFLYDADQRIMISPAIGDADRLSSCSWKLRKKYGHERNLLTNVMVFKQPPTDAFQGEKGMTTFRYNLNGVELDVAAFEKLQKEIALRPVKMTLPNEEYLTTFYLGQYQDATGNSHEVVIREGRIKIWQDNSDYYPPTGAFYYEVVVNKALIQMVKKAI